MQYGDQMMKAVDINTQVVQQNFAAAQSDGVRIGGPTYSLFTFPFLPSFFISFPPPPSLEYGGLSTTLTTLVAGRLDVNLSNVDALPRA